MDANPGVRLFFELFYFLFNIVAPYNKLCAILRSFTLTFEDGSIRAMRESRKYQLIEQNLNSEIQNL